jgi:hypothetical protein
LETPTELWKEEWEVPVEQRIKPHPSSAQNSPARKGGVGKEKERERGKRKSSGRVVD